MIVSVHQPNYLPWLGYFYKILVSDKFVFLDDVQFTKGDYINRVEIFSPQNQKQWLTIPINVKLGTNINHIVILSEKWKVKHLKTIKQIYGKTQYFDEVYTNLENIILNEYATLAELNISIIRSLLKQFNYRTDSIYLSSSLDINNLISDDRLIEILNKINCNKYLSGSGGFNYQSVAKFKSNNIDVLSYCINKDFLYETKYKNIIGLSVLDFIFNEGYNKEKLLEFGELNL